MPATAKERELKKAYASRYGNDWKNISRITRALTGGGCCYPGCRAKAISTHHVNYVRPYVPLENVFGLCGKHHGTDGKHRKLDKPHPDAAHHPNNWDKGSRDKNYQDAHNKPAYLKKLKLGAALLQQH